MCDDAGKMAGIFLSHSSDDKDPALALYAVLARLSYDAVFIDHANIAGGTYWEQEIYRALRTSRAVVFLASKLSMASKWCFAELCQAIALEKNILVVRLYDAPLHENLRDLQAIAFAGDLEARLREAFAALRSIRRQCSRLPPANRPIRASSRSDVRHAAVRRP
jgi:hypothetical protein